MNLPPEILTQIVLFAFFAGGAYLMLRETKRQVEACWRRYDELSKRERVHHSRTLILVSLLSAGQDMKTSKEVRELLESMAKENAKGNGED